MRAIRRSLLREGKRGLWRILLALFLVLLCGIIVLVARYSVRLLPNCIMLYHCVFLNVFVLLHEGSPIKSRDELKNTIFCGLVSVVFISLSLFCIFAQNKTSVLIVAFLFATVMSIFFNKIINF